MCAWNQSLNEATVLVWIVEINLLANAWTAV